MLLWIGVALVLVVLLALVWGMAFQGWGAPHPYWVRRRRRAGSYGAAPSPLDEEAVELRPGDDPSAGDVTDPWGSSPTSCGSWPCWRW